MCEYVILSFNIYSCWIQGEQRMGGGRGVVSPVEEIMKSVLHVMIVLL